VAVLILMATGTPRLSAETVPVAGGDAPAAPRDPDTGSQLSVVAAPASANLQALTLDRCDDLVRPPTLFRLRLSRGVTPQERLHGPMALEISLSQGQTLLASDFITISHLGELRDGVTLALAPAQLANHGAEAVVLRVSLLNENAPTVGAPFTPMEALTRTLPTPPSLAGDLDGVQRQVQALAPASSLLRLWAEQGAEITQGEPSLERCHELERLLALLHRALAPGASMPTQDGSLVAYRDLTDGSVQPERRYPPGVSQGGEAWLLASEGSAPLKSAWPQADERIQVGATQAGCLLVQEYPAGDARWEGIALLRAARRLSETAHGRVLLIGQGRAAIAALCLAALHPEHVAAVRLLDPAFAGRSAPPLPSAIPVTISGAADASAQSWGQERARSAQPQDPAFWQLAPAPSATAVALPLSLVAPELATALCRYCLRPFVVVVGTDEHKAAQEDNRELAHRFIGAWAMHAQGLPPCVDDVDFDPKAYRSFAWILIGNPRSNRVISRLAKRHPLSVTWDSRSLQCSGVVYPRTQRRAVALELTRDDGGSAVLLDGAPAWSAQGLPLVGLSPPVIGAAPMPMPSPSASPEAPMMARP
jgi:pimeloyl-ACP methyl ester carboxylesterase